MEFHTPLGVTLVIFTGLALPLTLPLVGSHIYL